MKLALIALAIVIAVLAAAASVAVAATLSSTPDVNRFGIPRCQEDEVISRHARCVHPDTAEFVNGYWRR